MNSNRCIVVLSVLLLGSRAVASEAPAPWVITLQSAGPVPFGVSKTEASRLLGAPLVNDGTYAETDGCYYARSSNMPEGVEFMIEDGVVVRVDVSTRSIRTPSDVGVGMSMRTVMATYPSQISVQGDPYDDSPGADWLWFLPHAAANQRYSLVFEVSGWMVTGFHAGLRGPNGYIEGCS